MHSRATIGSILFGPVTSFLIVLTVIYHLCLHLQEQFSWLNVFRYQTFRAMLGFLLAFLFVLTMQPLFIAWLQRHGLKGQPIRQDGPRDHLAKQGTPTMGGAVVVAAIIIVALMLCDLTNRYVWLSLAVFGAYSAVGFVDDWRKIRKQNTKGLRSHEKLLWQGGIAAVAAAVLVAWGFPTDLSVPFFKDLIVPLGLLFIPAVMLVVVGTSNAVNLTDGLDGLAIGPVMTVALTYAIFAYVGGHATIADYLGIHHLAGVGELSIIMATVVAAGLGFLWYNTFPAQVFMGDLGALGLGGLLGFVAVLTKHELLLPIAGGVFVLEACSVIIQVYSFKLMGRRVFRMAPIHHHFELKGWAEPKIIVRFWIISIVLALVTLTSLKLR